MYILIMRRGRSSVLDTMFTYSLHIDPYVVTFYLGLRIGVIGPTFYISIVIWLGTLFTSFRGFY